MMIRAPWIMKIQVIPCRLICVFAGRIGHFIIVVLLCLINVLTLFSACLSGYRRLDNNALPVYTEIYDDNCALDNGYTSDISTCFQNCSSIGSCTGFVSLRYESNFICVLLSCTNLTYYQYPYYPYYINVTVPGYYTYFKDENCTVGESSHMYVSPVKRICLRAFRHEKF